MTQDTTTMPVMASDTAALVERLQCDCDAEECTFREAASTIQSLTTRIAELEAENGRLRECLRSIKIEASRETGSWAHLKRCIAVQARATLTETYR